jgi:hypothetical protein
VEQRRVLIFGAAAFIALFAVQAGAGEGGEPCFTEGFETGLDRWRVGDDGKQPLVLTDDRAFEGQHSAYSGPPGTTRVSRTKLPATVGRLEVRFYDDGASPKHQMAIALGRPKHILGIAARGGPVYETRVGRTYTATNVQRSKGWHRFAWVCDGQRTAGFIDGTPVAVTGEVRSIREVVLGSFWDASTGWYDAVRAWPRAKEHAAAVAQAQQALERQKAERAAALRRQLAADAGKLDQEYRAQTRRPLGPPTPLARECYRRLLRYVRYTQPRLRDWPAAPGCRYHKRDGHREHDVRQNATVALGYAALLLGDYDAEIAGVPREQIERDLLGLLRYIAITHKANLLPTGDGRPWGDQWQSALWAHWAGRAAWLAWDRLDDETRLMFARLIEHEADRFNTRAPDSGEWRDTKAEENAWNAMLIALAACMFPDHPHAELWEERAIVYLVNSYARKSDLEETATVDGKPVKERVSAVTVHPDFTLENHGRVHPDYLGCFGLMLRSAPLYHAAGREPPEALFYNVPGAWDVLKHLTAMNGSYFYVNGQDWWPHRHGSPLTVSALTSVLLDDPDSAFLERQTLDFLGRMHARFEDGRAWDRREFNYANAEEEMVARYAELYLLHRLLGDGPAPHTREQFLGSVCGVRTFDIGGFVTHRTPAKFVSFAWVNGAMGLVWPGDDTWFTSPSERGLVGRIRCTGLKDTRPKVLAKTINAGENSFSLAARIARCEGAIEQGLALFSLADGSVIVREHLVAAKDVTVKEIATGTFPILNEDAPGIARNQRSVYHEDGTIEIPGTSEESRGLTPFRSRWANVDDRFGVVTNWPDKAWRDRRAYQHSRLEEELIANHRAWPEGERFGAGQTIADLTAIIVPGRSATETAALRFTGFGDGAARALRLGSTVVLSNLGPDGVTLQVREGHDFALDPLETAILGDAPQDLLHSP